MGALSLMLILQQLQGDLTPKICEDASNSFLISCLAIDAAVVIVTVLLKRYWDKRYEWSPGIRLGVSIVIVVAISTALVAWNPLRNDFLQDCVESEEFSRYVVMSHVAAVPRGLVLGGAVSVILLIILLLMLGVFGKRGRK